MPASPTDPSRDVPARARDALLRRTNGAMAAIAAAALALSGLLSAVAAQAFKGHQADSTRPASRPAAATPPPRRIHVPPPQRIPAIAGQPAPLAPPAQPPTAVTPSPVAPAPAPQVSGGS
jgi:hypothetical protein